MKLQFSITSLLACTAVIALVFSYCANIPVREGIIDGRPNEIIRSPNHDEVVDRLAWSEPLAVGATINTLCAFRRLKSRRHTEPPVA